MRAGATSKATINSWQVKIADMLLDRPIRTPRLLLRTLQSEDLDTSSYLTWLHDARITRYLEVRFNPPADSLELLDFVSSCNASSDTLLLGMFLVERNHHIGNIKLGPINPHHQRAEIGLLIGDTSQWGKGYAAEAIEAVTDYALSKLGLIRLGAGFYAGNTGSHNAFRKVGYFDEGRLIDYWDGEGVREDQILVGITRPLYLSRRHRLPGTTS